MLLYQLSYGSAINVHPYCRNVKSLLAEAQTQASAEVMVRTEVQETVVYQDLRLRSRDGRTGLQLEELRLQASDVGAQLLAPQEQADDHTGQQDVLPHVASGPTILAHRGHLRAGNQPVSGNTGVRSIHGETDEGPLPGDKHLEVNAMEKRCPRCRATKPVEEFGPNKSRKNGRSGFCRICDRLSKKTYKRGPQGRVKDRQSKIKRMTAWQKTPEGRAKRKAYHSSFRGQCARDLYKGAEVKERRRTAQLKQKYGLTLERFSQMLKNQKGTCMTCQVILTSKRGYRGVCVDHCHRTGRVRGILCWRCNVLLGHVNDDPKLLRRLALYLERST